MKLRYYLRGMGTGIIIASLIFLISSVFQTPMTDAAIKKRAENGMVEKTNGTTISESEKELSKTKDKTKSKEKTTMDDKKSQSKTSSENRNTEENNKSEENATGEDSKNSDVTTNQKSNKADDSTEEEGSGEKTSVISKNPDNSNYKNNQNSTGIPFSVTSGDTSQSVGKRLYQRGLVDDAGKFSSYMESHNIDEKIMQGNYDIPKNATYSQISDIITGK